MQGRSQIKPLNEGSLVLRPRHADGHQHRWGKSYAGQCITRLFHRKEVILDLLLKANTPCIWSGLTLDLVYMIMCLMKHCSTSST
jgi:hypothetical protein